MTIINRVKFVNNYERNKILTLEKIEAGENPLALSMSLKMTSDRVISWKNRVILPYDQQTEHQSVHCLHRLHLELKNGLFKLKYKAMRIFLRFLWDRERKKMKHIYGRRRSHRFWIKTSLQLYVKALVAKC